jgi:hypothetical protein
MRRPIPHLQGEIPGSYHYLDLASHLHPPNIINYSTQNFVTGKSNYNNDIKIFAICDALRCDCLSFDISINVILLADQDHIQN